MYIVVRAYDDFTADILDIGNFRTRHFENKELLNFLAAHEVIGAVKSGHKIVRLTTYDYVQFASEGEAYEYLREEGLSTKDLIYAEGYWWVFINTNRVEHVEYKVYFSHGDEKTFGIFDASGRLLGCTPYIQAATSLDRQTAKRLAYFCKKNSKHGNYWKTLRLVNGQIVE